MRVPEEERGATRLRERGSEHEEERDHVGEHSRPVSSAQLGSEPAQEAHPPARPAPAAVDANTHVRGQLVPADARAEHHHLVEPICKRADEVECLREDGVVGVESLGDEDESQPDSRAPASVRSTSSLIEAANCSAE